NIMYALQNPMVIHVYHPYRQPDGENHCQAVNGHCSHLCLPAPQINSRSPKISCACPDGLRLMADGLMCGEEVGVMNTSMNKTYLTEPNMEEDSGLVAGIVIAVVTIVLILLALIAFVVYRHYLHRNVTSMNFDNPVYRKTTEDQFSLEKNQYQPQRIYPATVGEEVHLQLT
ncbi:hypothetical protein L9F63_008334, partial [Diploptera punctata]